MIPALPILHVPLQRQKGAFKPCRWCKAEHARFEGKLADHPAIHEARVICEGCGRQIAWASARACRKAERLAALDVLASMAPANGVAV